jgi:hypothetical protein
VKEVVGVNADTEYDINYNNTYSLEDFNEKVHEMYADTDKLSFMDFLNAIRGLYNLLYNVMATTEQGKRIRGLNDFVVVAPVEPVDREYELQWFITTEQGIEYNVISERIEKAVLEYEAWQRGLAGRDIVPDRLIKLCLGAGAKRVVLKGLEFEELKNHKVARLTHKILPGVIEAE